VVKYHGLARPHLMPSGFLMRPLLNGGTLGRLERERISAVRDPDRGVVDERLTREEKVYGRARSAGRSSGLGWERAAFTASQTVCHAASTRHWSRERGGAFRSAGVTAKQAEQRPPHLMRPPTTGLPTVRAGLTTAPFKPATPDPAYFRAPSPSADLLAALSKTDCTSTAGSTVNSTSL
jgi:hypothetical protein